MPSNNDQSNTGIERLKKKLYQRGAGDFLIRRSNLSPVYRQINREWGEANPLQGAVETKKNNPWLKALLFSFVFFVLAIGLAFYMFFSGSSVVSDKNIDVVIKGPVTLKAGDELNLQLAITNKNSINIEQAELTTTFPAGTRSPADSAKDLTYVTQSLGEIKPGETVNLSNKALIFGKENDQPEVKFTLRYHLASSNTLFEKDILYRTKISASPIDLGISAPNEINSGQELDLDLRVAANSDKPMLNVLLQMSYPSGFQLKSSDIPPTTSVNGNSVWQLGDIPAGGEKIIHLKGTIEGLSEEIKSFEAKVGTANDQSSQKVSILYNDVFKTVAIKKSFLGLTLANKTTPASDILFLNKGVPDEYILSWINNLPVKVQDLSIVLHLSGEVLDKTAVSAEGAYYSSIDNTVTWSKDTLPAMASVDAGVSKELSLVLSVLPLLRSDGTTFKNPQVNVDATISGTRVSEGAANEAVQTDISKVIKINTDVTLLSKTLHRSGPFSNSGAIPPVAEKPTTYTINWLLSNTSNNVKNAKVEATIPLGVTWVGMISPASEDVSYDDQTRKVTWNVGDLKAGTGIDTDSRQAFFQVSLLPSVDQVGSSPSLLKDIVFTGQDDWSGNSLKVGVRNATTVLTGESSSKGEGSVVP